ncbi:IS66 Orf2 like protein [Nannocystis exedens]|uniref:IS66 Orf2 like protein n=1 Tax=Nannocystis exedens TaxID=54 RepID=A0A1I2IWX4_9BACT|nr:IS66 family insertion sequence element accessory protein TnpB [Nannocystis exedens]SFF45001.1 IS66 Orf2 like protein [Nannocystis exedens]
MFLGRRADRLKLLWWDHNGFAVLYKRLHRATTTAPKAANPSQRSTEIDEKPSACRYSIGSVAPAPASTVAGTSSAGIGE